MRQSTKNIHFFSLGLWLSGACLCLILLNCTQQSDQNSANAQMPQAADTSRISEPVFVDPDAGRTWNIFGLQIVGKIMSEQTAGQYSVVISTTPPQGGPPLHVHSHEDEMFYVLEGEYEFRCGDEARRVSAGTLVHLPRGIPHGFRNVGTAPGVLMNTITPGGFEQFFEEIDQLPKDKPLDRGKVTEIAAKYGLRFLPGQ